MKFAACGAAQAKKHQMNGRVHLVFNLNGSTRATHFFFYYGGA